MSPNDKYVVFNYIQNGGRMLFNGVYANNSTGPLYQKCRDKTLKVFLRRNAVINIPNPQVGIVSKFIDEVVHWISFIQNHGLDLH